MIKEPEVNTLELETITIDPEVAPTPETEVDHFYRQWIEALRSGEYEQGRNYLHFKPVLYEEMETWSRYCCLGVVNEVVFGANWAVGHRGGGATDDHGQTTSLSFNRRCELKLEKRVAPRDISRAKKLMPHRFEITDKPPMFPDRESLLMALNDNGVPFKRIADFLEASEWWKEDESVA